MIGYIENFFTADEVEWLKWYWSVLPNKLDTGQRLRSMAYYDQPFFNKMLQRLNDKILPNEEITTVNLYSDYSPGGIHSDGYIDFDKNYDVYIIADEVDEKTLSKISENFSFNDSLPVVVSRYDNFNELMFNNIFFNARTIVRNTMKHGAELV